MLDSRYIHLHEALGLGPMWLNATARTVAGTGQPENRVSAPEAAPPAATADSTAGKAATAPVPPSRPAPIPTPSAGQSEKQRQPEKSHTVRRTLSPENAKLHPDHLATLRQVNSDSLYAPPPPPAKPAAPEYPSKSIEAYLAELTGRIAPASVMALSVCASPADLAAGRLFSGEDGVLLEKMLAAVQLAPQDVFFGSWLSDLPDFNPKPPIGAVAAATARVAAECRLTGARALLLMGGFFEREDVIAQVRTLALPYFVIPHPQRILADPSLKRGTWNTLQAMRAELDRAA